MFSFLVGFLVRGANSVPMTEDSASGINENIQPYQLLGETQTLLDGLYLYEQPDEIIREYGAIRGLLQTLDDPGTFFIEPPVSQSEADGLAGVYGGIGVSLQRGNNGEWLLFPFETGPARGANIQDGDILIAINGVPLQATDAVEVVNQKLRGEVIDGNGVELTLARDEQITIFVPFDVIEIPSVISRVLEEDERIGYIKLLSFTNRAPIQLEAALQDLMQREIDALILDLRDNAGGLLQEALQITDQFLPDGIAMFQRSVDNEETFRTTNEGLAEDVMLAILINGNTASASELVAGAILDRERGVLIGQPSYGKGSIQQIHALSDGSSLHITTAEWLTPNRTILNQQGLQPTIVTSPDSQGTDVEFTIAIEYIQTQLAEGGNNE